MVIINARTIKKFLVNGDVLQGDMLAAFLSVIVLDYILRTIESSNCDERDFSSVRRTITDARARLSPTTVEALEIMCWGYRASVVCLDN